MRTHNTFHVFSFSELISKLAKMKNIPDSDDSDTNAAAEGPPSDGECSDWDNIVMKGAGGGGA